jgi:predicted nucleotidyltransferase
MIRRQNRAERDSPVPDFVQEVVDAAVARLAPERVILFGSRARGDAEATSDYDLAIDAPGLAEPQWARFVLDAKDGFGALLELDLVRLDQADHRLRERIENEGQLLYVRR